METLQRQLWWTANDSSADYISNRHPWLFVLQNRHAKNHRVGHGSAWWSKAIITLSCAPRSSHFAVLLNAICIVSHQATLWYREQMLAALFWWATRASGAGSSSLLMKSWQFVKPHMSVHNVTATSRVYFYFFYFFIFLRDSSQLMILCFTQ